MKLLKAKISSEDKMINLFSQRFGMNWKSRLPEKTQNGYDARNTPDCSSE
jgi:hypothetical protein